MGGCVKKSAASFFTLHTLIILRFKAGLAYFSFGTSLNLLQ